MNIDRNNSMIAGTIVLEQVTDTSIIDEMTPSVIKFDKAIEIGIDKHIVEFLQEREKNFIKAPNSILTVRDLQKWLTAKKHLNNSTKP